MSFVVRGRWQGLDLSIEWDAGRFTVLDEDRGPLWSDFIQGMAAVMINAEDAEQALVWLLAFFDEVLQVTGDAPDHPEEEPEIDDARP